MLNTLSKINSQMNLDNKINNLDSTNLDLKKAFKDIIKKSINSSNINSENKFKNQEELLNKIEKSDGKYFDLKKLTINTKDLTNIESNLEISPTNFSESINQSNQNTNINSQISKQYFFQDTNKNASANSNTSSSIQDTDLNLDLDNHLLTKNNILNKKINQVNKLGNLHNLSAPLNNHTVLDSLDFSEIQKVIEEIETKNDSQIKNFQDNNLHDSKIDYIKSKTNLDPKIEKNILNNIQDQFKYMLNKNIKSIEFAVNPKELGKIIIDLRQNNGEYSAQIKVDNLQTFSLIDSNIHELKNNVINNNINLNEFNLSFTDKQKHSFESKELRFTANHDSNIEQSLNEIINKNENLIDLYI